MTGPSDPRVDVLIPVRAPAPWLEAAIQSIEDQTAQNWHLILVMDGESQAVRAVTKRIVPDGRATLALSPGRGLVDALNHGLQLSRAEYIARLDADDISHPTRLERQIEHMDAHPGCVALGTAFRPIDEVGRTAGGVRNPHDGSFLRKLRWRCPIAHPSAIFRRSTAITVGGYRAAATGVEDYDLWLRMATLGDVHNVGEVLLRYRVHAEQVTRNVRFSPDAITAIRDSRCSLAQARGESIHAALARHALWVAANRAKGRL